MTDLEPGVDATRSCPACGAQNDVTAAACHACGAALPATARGSGDAEREDLEVVEVARAVGLEGFDTEFDVTGGATGDDDVVCPVCGCVFRPERGAIDGGIPAFDTPTATRRVVVRATCPSCSIQGHAVLVVGAA